MNRADMKTESELTAPKVIRRKREEKGLRLPFCPCPTGSFLEVCVLSASALHTELLKLTSSSLIMGAEPK